MTKIAVVVYMLLGCFSALFVILSLDPVKNYIVEEQSWILFASPYHFIAPLIDSDCSQKLEPGITHQTNSFGSSLTVAVADANQTQRGIFGLFGVGGIAYRTAAKQLNFDYFINASSEKQAADFLDKLHQIDPRPIRLLAIFDHGTTGCQLLGGKRVQEILFRELKKISLGEQTTLLLCGCYVGGGYQGRNYLRNLARIYSLTVVARKITNNFEAISGMEISSTYWVYSSPQHPEESPLNHLNVPTDLMDRSLP